MTTSPKEHLKTMKYQVIKETKAGLLPTLVSLAALATFMFTIGKPLADATYFKVSDVDQLRVALTLDRLGEDIDDIVDVPSAQRTDSQRSQLSRKIRKYQRICNCNWTPNANP